MPRQVDEKLWRYCPKCAAEEITTTEGKAWQCNRCGFLYFHNVAATVGALIQFEGQYLFAVRAKPPSLGMLDLPGGFVDADETMEQALCRELDEELGLRLPPSQLTYLGSVTNRYLYGEVEYCTADCVFAITLTELPKLVARDDISAWIWLTAAQAADEQFAFRSVERVVQQWITP
jgi:ADP-ribose pyrophosphatase YjhB (NUDIX family)